MAINQHWIRWSIASLAKHFDGLKGAYPLYVEGAERDTDHLKTFGEFRVDGPFITNPCKDNYYVDIEVNILIQAHMNPSDLYAGLKAVGQFAAAFVHNIRVYKYGDAAADDGTLLGCFVLRSARNNDSVDVGQFGIVHQDTRLTQYTVEGHYRMELEI